MSELEQIKRAMASGKHTDGDLQWCVERIEELEAAHKRLLTALDQITTTGDWQRTQEIAEEALEKALRHLSNQD